MLEIVLLILKIAGIIFAAILGILLAGLFCVLFVPVRYRGDFSAADAESGKKEIGAVLRATWLLWLVRAYVSYEESVRVRIKLLFFTLMDTAKEKKDRKKKKKPKRDKEEKRKKKKKQDKDKEDTLSGSGENGKEAAELDKDTKNSKNAEEPGKDTGNGKEAAGSDKDTENSKKVEGEIGGETEDGPAQSQADRKTDGGRSKEKSSSKEKKGIKKRISNILQTIRDFCDKLKRIKEKTKQAKVLWTSDHMVSGRSFLWKQFLYLLRHTRPRKLEGYLRFGFEDPSTTGYAMAVYGISCSIWRPRLSVEPDFEKQILDCHVRIKGKIRVCHFLKAVLVLFFSKDVRHVIKDIKEL